ncbi:hypothetical protein AB0K62_31195 [Streptomyces halstedii]|uniref:hypothetical protein n=1 Tax=Streptomyces halstedii TaxID=1944 RepID=UPI0034611A88
MYWRAARGSCREASVNASHTHDDLVTAGGTYASFRERRARAHGWRLEAARS